MADAIAMQDGRLFADALEAYPMNQFTAARLPFFQRIFEIFADLPPALQQAKTYIRW
ncbi:MAG: hypothetical protein WCI51_15830 [Lentisphaerota bacterium]